MMVFFTITYLLATEGVQAKKPKGEVLLFRRGHRPTPETRGDLETAQTPKSGEEIATSLPTKLSANIHKQTSIFQWKDICYDIKIKKEDRRILDHVDGWVKPGTLTALMVCHLFPYHIHKIPYHSSAPQGPTAVDCSEI
jgi:ATP-binding cassette subfamily G (WHITE) protein 2 (PDR)